MGVAVAQMLGGLFVSKLASKWGASSKSVPTVTGRDLVPMTESEAPKTYEVGGENKAKRGRSALTIKQDDSNNYNPMNL